MDHEVKVYSSRVPAGLFALFLLALTVLSAKAGIPGWQYTLFTLILPLLLYWRLRLDAEEGTFFICGVIPVSRIAWYEVAEWTVAEPGFVYFSMRNGRRRKWELTGFFSAARKEIEDCLRERIASAEKRSPASLSPDAWLRETVRRRNRSDRIAMVLWAILLGIVGTFLLADALVWDARIRRWTQVPGVILRNDRVRVSSGRSSRTVSKIEYEYRFKGKRYTGSRILYDSDYFPEWIKPGSPRKILVDPADPGKSAAMKWYRGHWGLLFRYGWPVFCFIVLAVSLGICGFGIRRRNRFAIPEKLRAYAAAVPAFETEPSAYPLRGGGVRLTRPPELVDGRFLRIRERRAGWRIAVTVLVGGGLAIWLRLRGDATLLAVIVLFLILPLFRPRTLLIDLREQRLIRPGVFWRTEELPLADCRGLLISPDIGSFHLGVLLRDGTRIAVCRTPEAYLPLLLDLLPDLAERLGRVPVGFQHYFPQK